MSPFAGGQGVISPSLPRRGFWGELLRIRTIAIMLDSDSHTDVKSSCFSGIRTGLG
jgi:hypothetical protein